MTLFCAIEGIQNHDLCSDFQKFTISQDYEPKETSSPLLLLNAQGGPIDQETYAQDDAKLAEFCADAHFTNSGAYVGLDSPDLEICANYEGLKNQQKEEGCDECEIAEKIHELAKLVGSPLESQDYELGPVEKTSSPLLLLNAQEEQIDQETYAQDDAKLAEFCADAHFTDSGVYVGLDTPDLEICANYEGLKSLQKESGDDISGRIHELAKLVRSPLESQDD